MFGLLKGIASKAIKLVTGRAGTAVATIGTGVAVGGLAGDLIGDELVGALVRPKRRRRRSKRLTNADFAELLALKAVVGPRSPLVLIRGLKMLGK